MEKIDVKAHKHQHYFIDGVEVPSVTQALSMINKPFLVNWANKLGREGKSATEVSRISTMIGTLTHAYIQSYLDDPVNFMDNVVYDVEDEDDVAILKTALSCFGKFKAFYDIFSPTTIKSEVSLIVNDVDFKDRYGGTIDYIAKINDAVIIIDFKTSNNVSNEYLLQLVAYYYLIQKGVVMETNEKLDYDIKNLALLMLPKEKELPFQFVIYDTNQLLPLYDFFKDSLHLYNFPVALKDVGQPTIIKQDIKINDVVNV